MKIQEIPGWLNQPPVAGPGSLLLLRLMVGGVFFWEGIIKFVFFNQGTGRFAKLGIPFPEIMGPTIGTFEIVGGLFLLVGLLTRWTTILFVMEMIVAILSTKISLFLGTYPLAPPPAPPVFGFWAVLHEIRSDYAQIMVSLFLFINGSGPLSLDAILRRKR